MSLSQAESWARRAKRQADSDTSEAVKILAKAVLQALAEIKRLEARVHRP